MKARVTVTQTYMIDTASWDDEQELGEQVSSGGGDPEKPTAEDLEEALGNIIDNSDVEDVCGDPQSEDINIEILEGVGKTLRFEPEAEGE